MLNNHEALIKVAWANNGDILKSHGSQVSSVKRYFCVVEKFIDIILLVILCDCGFILHSLCTQCDSGIRRYQFYVLISSLFLATSSNAFCTQCENGFQPKPWKHSTASPMLRNISELVIIHMSKNKVCQIIIKVTKIILGLIEQPAFKQ